MRKAALFYNPLSGRRRARRLVEIEAAVAVLRDAGVEVQVAPTRAAAEATGQVRQAIEEGYDTILACGGDGTVHDVLQGMVGSQAALGIIPLGTANALAHDICLPLTAPGAARALLTATPQRIAAGKIEYTDFRGEADCRYFTVAAGVGVDAHLFYELNPQVKSRLGMAAYYAKATRLWLTHALENFEVEIEDKPGRKVSVSQLLAVRIRNFGGVLRELAPGASLERDDLRLVLFVTRSRLAYLQYVVRGLCGRTWAIRGIELCHGIKVRCHGLESSPRNSRIFVEADGELLGTVPATISMIPDALTLLMPV